MKKKKKSNCLSEEQKKLFNKDYLDRFIENDEVSKDFRSEYGDGRSALNDAWAKGIHPVTNRGNKL